MLRGPIHANALEASERYLLVPVPELDRDAFSFGGFAKQVFERYGRTAAQFMSMGGIALGSYRMMDARTKLPEQLPPYTLAFASIHERRQNGWAESHHLLASVLLKMHQERHVNELAVAGIPGGGLSGLRDGANLSAIREVMAQSAIEVTIYDNDGQAGDPAMVLETTPPREDRAYAGSPVIAYSYIR